ncbi:MAG: hypothetical protein EPO22_13055 [Dehalococcoidia bacterium]|nr:MAG: hypothetical protein EPO22_13055 [Dehalococcoidia bacterium]
MRALTGLRWRLCVLAIATIAAAALTSPIERARAFPFPLPSSYPYGPGGNIDTIAGGGIGDGGSATLAQLQSQRVAVGPTGDVYIADTGDCRIRKVSGGTITTVAGDGVCRYNGDGITATSASIRSPMGVAVDGSGNVFIADTGNCRIREVTGAMMSTVAGTGVCGSSGDGGPATSATIEVPSGVGTDAAGNFYFVDQACGIREVSGGVISTVAQADSGNCGNRPPFTGINQARSLTVTPGGDFYFADGCKVWKDVGGVLSVAAGGSACGYGGDSGAATSALLQNPNGLAVDTNGDLYIADQGNCRIRRVSGGTITTFAGNGTCTFAGDGTPATTVPVPQPFDVAIAGGVLYIADGIDYAPGYANEFGCRVQRVASGTVTTFAGNGDCTYELGDGGPALAGGFGRPVGAAVDNAGQLYVADYVSCRIRKVSGGTITTVAGTGTCGSTSDPGTATAAQLDRPGGVAVDVSGALYIADTYNCRIRKVDFGIVPATISTIAGTGACATTMTSTPALSANLNLPNGIAVLGADVYFTDLGDCLIHKLSSGVITTLAGNGACGFAGTIGGPYGIAVAGNGDVYFADTYLCKVRKVSGGLITTVAGSGINAPYWCDNAPDQDGGPATSAALVRPTGVALDPSGNLYVSDVRACRVRKVTAGIISTVAGGWAYPTPFCGFYGDGGPAFDSAINSPLGLTFDPAGSLYITDAGYGAGRVRVVYATDTDADGYTDVLEAQLGENPGASCSIMRADVNMSGKVTLADLILTAQQYNETIPPATARYDQNADGKITLADLILEVQVYNQPVTACG